MNFPRDIKDRNVEYSGRRRLTPVAGQPDVFDVTREEGTVYDEGTAINKAYLQPMEDALAGVTNSFSANADRYIGNTKLVEDFQDASLWTSGAGTQSEDTVNVKIGNKTLKIEENDNSGGYVYSDQNNISLDLSKLSNGEASTNDDYVVFVFYISDVNFIDTSLGVRLGLCEEAVYNSSNQLYYDAKVGLVTGWNYLEIKKSDFSSNGATGFDDVIQSKRVLWKSLPNAITKYVSFQHAGVVKKDPTLDKPNPFQYMGTSECEVVNGDYLVAEEFGFNTIKSLGASNNTFSLYVNPTVSYQDFMANLVTKTDDSEKNNRSLTMYTDSSNWIKVSIESDKLNLATRVSGTITNYTTPLAINAGDEVSFELARKGSNVIGSAIVNLNPSRQATISLSGITTDLLKMGIGSLVNADENIASYSITEIVHAHHSDIAEVAKRVEGESDWKDITLPNTSGGGSTVTWESTTAITGYRYYHKILDHDYKRGDIVVFEVGADDLTYDAVGIAEEAGIANSCFPISDNYITFASNSIPSSEIPLTYKIIKRRKR